ncbi:hypothetical protein [Tardiphaga sp.]|uniref:hypothetical protein n=1 Tax=Tardiphaga sp. TaxID=1926292 RepID=UPI00262F5DD6|nr:hypothetical protein [Tardiphaga sp.]
MATADFARIPRLPFGRMEALAAFVERYGVSSYVVQKVLAAQADVLRRKGDALIERAENLARQSRNERTSRDGEATAPVPYGALKMVAPATKYL